MMIFTFVFLYAFSANQASAAVGNQDVEIEFMYSCGMALPGIDPSFYVPTSATLKTTIPERVAADKEFYLTNTSLIITMPFSNPENNPPGQGKIEGANFKITYNNGSVQTFVPDIDIVIPPGTNGYSLKLTDGTEVGPFIANEDGEITIKLDQTRMNVINEISTLGFVCVPPIDNDITIAKVTVDGKAPVITLHGEDTVIVKQGDPYVEKGATAQDNYDGDLTDNIEISGDVDTNTIGTYTVTYTVSDSVGNVATAERTVKVVEPFGDFYSGEGPPSDSLGSNGDTYLDVTTGDVYKRNPNTWTKVGNIKGDDGKQGAKILTGEGAPQADVGNVGDLYFDTKTGDVYEKTADGWKKIANLQGPSGPAGSKGPKGADGTGGTSGSGDSSGKDKPSKTGSSKVASKDGGDKKGSKALGGKLPKTATSLPTLVLIGTLLFVAGSIMYFRHRKAIE